jgi:hypothetical protein
MPAFSSNATVLMWPRELRPVSLSFPIQVSSTTFKNPISFTSQTFTRPAAQFLAIAQFAPLTKEQHKTALVFIAKLRGEAGRFYFPADCCGGVVPDVYQAERVTPVPLESSNAIVTVDNTRVTSDATQHPYESFYAADGLSADPTVITGTLWLNSGIAPLTEGKYISWDDTAGYRHLHLIVGMDKVGSKTSLTVEPPMRYAPTSSTAIHVHAPSGIFKLTSDAVGALTQQQSGFSDFSITAEQAWPARFVL